MACCYATHLNPALACVFQNYCVQGLELFASYLFQDVLELYDWNLTGTALTPPAHPL